MAHTKTSHIGSWDTFHSNGPYPTKLLFDIDTDKQIPTGFKRYNDTAVELQRLISDSMANNERIRSYGSTWSLSNIAHQKDRMLYTSRLNIKIPLGENHLSISSAYQLENLFFVQCGTTIKEISEYISRKGKSLKTCGASNGQTIAGAISTGVHGSALDVGSIQDYVVGLNILIGPGTQDNVYLERHTKPALNKKFAAALNARIIRNDDLFNAALVSLGSFGIIHGVAFEVEDAYLLKRYVKKIKRKEALELAMQMNFGSSGFKIPAETREDGSGIRPYHYKLYINPYKDEDFVTEIIFKKPYRTNYPDPIPRIKTAIFKDLPTWIAIFAAKCNRIIPLLVGALKSSAFPKLDEDIEGTLGEIFWDTTQQSAAFGCAIGLDNKDAEKALELMENLMNNNGPIPGILSMRFVKKSEALLAFTKFDTTCILEMDGILWKGNQHMISLEDFLRKVVEVLKGNHIAFTFHWGKNADWSFPGLVDYMFGDLDDSWKNIRSALLTKQMASLFSNDFLDSVLLSDYRVGVPASLIEPKDDGL